MKLDKLECIICSQALFNKIMPFFQNQIEQILTQEMPENVQTSNNNRLIILAENEEMKRIDLKQDWSVVSIDRNRLDHEINGTITLRQLVNGIPIPIFLRNTEGVFIGCNPSFVEFMGILEDDLVGKTVFQVVPQIEAEEYRQRDIELIEKPHNQVYEGHITDINGETKDVIFRKSLLTDDQNKPIAIVGVIVDISKRKRIEASLWEYRNKLEDMVLERTVNLASMNEQLLKEVELRKQSKLALQESEHILRTIFNSTYDAILLLDTLCNIVNVNAKTFELFGIKEDQLREINFIEDLSSLDTDRREMKFRWELTISGKEQLFEWNACKPFEKSCFESEVFLRKISLENRDLILVNIRNITERKTVEKLLLQEHNKVKTALKHEMLLSTIATILNTTDNFFEVLENLILIINNTLHLTEVAFYPFSDYDKCLFQQGWLSKNELFNHEEMIVVNYIYQQIQSNNPIFITSLEGKTDNMKLFFLKKNINAFSAMPLKIVGQVSGMITFQSDSSLDWSSKHYGLFNTITNMLANSWERYLLLNQRIEVEKRNIQTVKLLESSSKLASIGVMAAGITHEINQPLNVIKIIADGVAFWNKRNPNILPDMFLGKMGKISQAVNRIDSIIKHMRSFWVPNPVSNEKDFFINEAIINALDMINNQLNSHGVEVIFEVHQKEIRLKGDMIHLEQIIINLCINAMHAMDQITQNEKIIKIKLTNENQHIKLFIEDNGPGLSQEQQVRLFDPFYSTKKPGEGMGLGLAIVKQFVEGFNGTIKAYNKEINSGAVFEIEIENHSSDLL